MARHVCPGIVLAVVLGCTAAPPRVDVELIAQPTTLSQIPRYFGSSKPLRADNDVVGACLYPDARFRRSDHWTFLTPDGARPYRRACRVGRR